MGNRSSRSEDCKSQELRQQRTNKEDLIAKAQFEAEAQRTKLRLQIQELERKKEELDLEILSVDEGLADKIDQLTRDYSKNQLESTVLIDNIQVQESEPLANSEDTRGSRKQEICEEQLHLADMNDATVAEKLLSTAERPLVETEVRPIWVEPSPAADIVVAKSVQLSLMSKNIKNEIPESFADTEVRPTWAEPSPAGDINVRKTWAEPSPAADVVVAESVQLPLMSKNIKNEIPEPFADTEVRPRWAEPSPAADIKVRKTLAEPSPAADTKVTESAQLSLISKNVKIEIPKPLIDTGMFDFSSIWKESSPNKDTYVSLTVNGPKLAELLQKCSLCNYLLPSVNTRRKIRNNAFKLAQLSRTHGDTYISTTGHSFETFATVTLCRLCDYPVPRADTKVVNLATTPRQKSNLHANTVVTAASVPTPRTDNTTATWTPKNLDQPSPSRNSNFHANTGVSATSVTTTTTDTNTSTWTQKTHVQPTPRQESEHTNTSLAKKPKLSKPVSKNYAAKYNPCELNEEFQTPKDKQTFQCTALQKLKQCRRPRSSQGLLRSFTFKLQEYIDTLKVVDPRYMHSPTIMKAVCAKLEPDILASWAEYAAEHARVGKPKVLTMLTFLHHKANISQRYSYPKDANLNSTSRKRTHSQSNI